MVKSIDREQGKVILSYKETLGSWEENVEKIYYRNKSKRKSKRNRKTQKWNFY